jgi:hypothetical protein
MLSEEHESSSLLLLRIRRRTNSSARFKRMLVVVAPKHFTTLFLRADLATSDPLVLDNLIKCSALLGIDLQHPPYDVPTFSG